LKSIESNDRAFGYLARSLCKDEDHVQIEEVAKAALFEKSAQKLLILPRLLSGHTMAAQKPRENQKFFGYFFFKRVTACFFL
jgi:hypothetical protein